MIATALCVVCSVLVSGFAVGLHDKQVANKELEMRRNVLLVAGLVRPQEHPSPGEIERLFAQIETRIVDLDSGEYVDPKVIDPKTYDQRTASKDLELSQPIAKDDFASIKRREKYAVVYLVKKGGHLDQVVLPIRGMGLWSILYGFVALRADTTTIRGLGFYEHGETPGLGGEVDNPKWKNKWKLGKKAFDDQWHVRIEVIKGQVTDQTEQPEFKVDGLSGATFTSNGVTNMLKFWLGEQGFGSYLKRLRTAGGSNG